MCKRCNFGHYSNGVSCVANPTAGPEFVSGCGLYELNILSEVVCTSCSSGAPLNGELSGFKLKIAECGNTDQPSNCQLSFAVDFEPEPTIRILADGSRRILAPTPPTAIGCNFCSGLNVLNIGDYTCAAPTVSQTGCIAHSAGNCTVCNQQTHQMQEQGVCSVKPTASPGPGPDPAPAPTSSTTSPVASIPAVGITRLLTLLSVTISLLLVVF